MDHGSSTQSKRKATLRLQMQGLLLLSLVLVLLLLSFVGDVEQVSPDNDHRMTEGSLQVGQAQTRALSNSELSKSQPSEVMETIDAEPTDTLGNSGKTIDVAKLEDSSSGAHQLNNDSTGGLNEDLSVDLVGDPTRAAATATSATDAVSTPKETGLSDLIEGQDGASKNPIRQVNQPRMTAKLADLPKWWGRSVGQRVTQSTLPLGSLGERIALEAPNASTFNDAGYEDSFPESNILSLLDEKVSSLEDDDYFSEPFDTSVLSGGATNNPTAWLVSSRLRRMGFTTPDTAASLSTRQSPEQRLGANGVGHSLADSTSDLQGSAQDATETVETNPYVGDLSKSDQDLYEPIVQSPYLQSGTTGENLGDQPSSKIAMTQLQSPVPGTSGPLLPAAPIGPGAGPAVNFPRSSEKTITDSPEAAASPSETAGGDTAPGGSSPSTSESSESDTSSEEDEAQDQPESNDEANAAEPADEPADEDSEKHMISELVGTGYGWFGRVFDSGFYFANEFTFLSPKTVGNVKVGVTDMLDETTVSESTDTGMGFGNRFTLGVRGRNAGLRCQYWTFASDHVVSESWQDYRPVPRFITASSSMLETVDLEITQQHALFGCQLESSFGGRYAKYDGQDSASLVDQLHDSLELTGLARATRNLRGAGPTFAIAGRKNLRINFGANAGDLLPSMDCEGCGLETCTGDCESWRCSHPCFPWNLYWNGRIAWLWAEESSGTVTEATVNYDGGDGGASTARSRDKALIFDDRDSSIFTLGFQVGLEYTRPVFTRSQLLARVGYEYQHWDLGKNVAEAQSFAFLSDNTNFGGRVDALASSNRNYLKLSGFTLLVGLNY